jgi:hypothetical protein
MGKALKYPAGGPEVIEGISAGIAAMNDGRPSNWKEKGVTPWDLYEDWRMRVFVI